MQFLHQTSKKEKKNNHNITNIFFNEQYLSAYLAAPAYVYTYEIKVKKIKRKERNELTHIANTDS